GRNRPEVVLPSVDQAEITKTGQAFQPLLSSGIGETVSEANQYTYDYRVLARRPGPLLIPSIRLSDGGRQGRPAPSQAASPAVPSAGRTAAFLGGVGPFELEASAAPTSLRVGAELVYSLQIRGPGALGSNPPEVPVGFGKLGLGLKLE